MSECIDCGERMEPGTQWAMWFCAACAESLWRSEHMAWVLDAFMDLGAMAQILDAIASRDTGEDKL